MYLHIHSLTPTTPCHLNALCASPLLPPRGAPLPHLHPTPHTHLHTHHQHHRAKLKLNVNFNSNFNRSQRFQGVMRDLSSSLKATYKAHSVAVIPGRWVASLATCRAHVHTSSRHSPGVMHVYTHHHVTRYMSCTCTHITPDREEMGG
jgi:hypothetical protein